MSAKVQVEGQMARIILSGDLDYATQSDIHSVIDTALNTEGVHQIEVDLASATFMDSSVIRALVNLQKAADAGGVFMTIVNSNNAIREIFVIGGFDKIFKLR